MDFQRYYRIFAVIICIILVFLGLKVIFPLLLPFFLGGLLSVTAEPAVRFGCEKCRLKRPLSAFFGVLLTLGIVVCAAVFLGGLAVREVKHLVQFVPQLHTTAQNGLDTLQSSLVTLTHRLPEAIQPAAQKTVTQLFSQDGQLWEMSSRKLPQLAASLAGKLPGSAVGVGTGILSAFLISSRLPALKKAVTDRIPEHWTQIWLRLKRTLGAWVKAQGKLMGVTFAIVATGLLLLRIPYAPVWAALAAVVDAVPLLGTGVMLLPWALVKWVQGEPLVAVGLACVYGAAALTRVMLEPRLVGKQLGLDPLAALVALYAGFRLWGFWGMVLAPVGAAVVKNLGKFQREK